MGTPGFRIRNIDFDELGICKGQHIAAGGKQELHLLAAWHRAESLHGGQGAQKLVGP